MEGRRGRDGSGFRVQGSGFRGQGPGARGQGPGARGQGPGARGQGPGARVFASAAPKGRRKKAQGERSEPWDKQRANTRAPGRGATGICEVIASKSQPRRSGHPRGRESWDFSTAGYRNGFRRGVRRMLNSALGAMSARISRFSRSLRSVHGATHLRQQKPTTAFRYIATDPSAATGSPDIGQIELTVRIVAGSRGCPAARSL